jgi:hypothetical protein
MTASDRDAPGKTWHELQVVGCRLPRAHRSAQAAPRSCPYHKHRRINAGTAELQGLRRLRRVVGNRNRGRARSISRRGEADADGATCLDLHSATAIASVREIAAVWPDGKDRRDVQWSRAGARDRHGLRCAPRAQRGRQKGDCARCNRHPRPIHGRTNAGAPQWHGLR